MHSKQIKVTFDKTFVPTTQGAQVGTEISSNMTFICVLCMKRTYTSRGKPACHMYTSQYMANALPVLENVTEFCCLTAN